MKPEASVVIPVKNRSSLLWDCLTGLSMQTLSKDRFEVVVIDNVSSEDIGAVISRARVELGLSIRSARTTEDRGPAPARNLGVSMATAPIIAFTDSDCRPDPAWLANALAAMAEDPEVAFATGPVLAKPGQVQRLTSKISFVTPEEHPSFPTANAFYRRAIFLDFGGFDVSLSFRDLFDRATECADTDLAWRVLEAGHRRVFLSNARIYHEIEDLGFFMWLIDTSRLFVLPLLVRRHPGLRRELLTAGLFFYPPTLLIYPAVVLLVLGVFAWPWLLALLPVLLVGQGIVRTRSLDVRVLLRFCARALLHLPRMIIMTASLIYGSVRFRCLVL